LTDDVATGPEAHASVVVDPAAQLMTHNHDAPFQRLPVPVQLNPSLASPPMVLSGCSAGGPAFPSVGFAAQYHGYQGGVSCGSGLAMYEHNTHATPNQAPSRLPSRNQL